MIIKIDALDTLFFKDGKPFTMGDDSWAQGSFPPSPSVIYGALRTAYFLQHPDKINTVNTTEDPTKNLVIKKILFFCNNDIYFPLPKDYVHEKNNSESEAFILKLIKNSFISSSGLEYQLQPENNSEVENVENGIFRWHTFVKSQTKKLNSVSYIKLSDFIIEEPKVGIGRENYSRTTAVGKLYNVNMLRLTKLDNNFQNKSIHLIVEFTGIELNEKGLFKLGAEGKFVNYSKFSLPDDLSFKNINYSGNIFRLYMATPAIFLNGSSPDLNKNEMLKDFNLELIANAIGKPTYIGGFDMAENKPKKMYKAVPAGAVYYFRTKDDINLIAKKLNGNSISEVNSNEGYGICYVGGIND